LEESVLEEVVQEETLEPIVVDLTAGKNKEIGEQTMTQLGGQVKWMLSNMFSGAPINAVFRGSPGQIDSFGKALYREKRYMNSYLKHGLGDARVQRDRSKLQNAIKGFEGETGLKWPFK
jgi:hypothetical protein